jgi:peptidyl-prolyl cis-trans isomerase C
MTRRALSLGLVMLAGCGDGAPPVPVEHQPLAGGAVALVGDLEIGPVEVAAIASAQGLPLGAARDRAVRDALFAAGATHDLPAEVEAARRRVLARALLRSLWAEATLEPISDDELAEATSHHWLRFDRPESWRTVHAVVTVSDKDDAAARAKAEALAQRIRQAVAKVAEQARHSSAPAFDEQTLEPKIVDPVVDAFRKAAGELATAPNVTIQPLPPVTAQRRVVQKGRQENSFLPGFVAGAVALERRGDLSAVVESDAGYHVILLLERIPERRAGRDERLRGLEQEILRVRGVRLRRTLVTKLEGAGSVSLASNVDALLTQVRSGEVVASGGVHEGDAPR